ncbi:MAG: hypothetical protein IPP30_14330 [Flavobacterium sp.]|nr:hypothetical protein [Flavobacterium sp.]
MRTIKLFSSIALLVILSLACSSSSDSDPAPSCESLSNATDAAEAAYNAATTATLVEKCNAYKTALQNEINGCGDEFGDLQNLIDGLDCTLPTTTGTLSMTVGSAPLVFDEITVTTTGTTRHVHGEKSNTTSYEINFDVEVGQTGANKINNFELRLFSHTYTPMIPSAFGNDWASNITVNSSTSVVGTFHGELESTTAINIQDLVNGVVNINF